MYYSSSGILCGGVNRKFITSCIINEQRLDGRELHDFRDVEILFSTNAYGQVEVTLGRTRVLCVVTSELVTPRVDRPNEGTLNFFVDFNNLQGRTVHDSNEVGTMLERLLKGSRAVDTEALCVVGGSKVWAVRVDIRGLADDGNLCDASFLAAVAALQHYRTQEVTVCGDSVTVHPLDEREPLRLCVHHLPLNITVAMFDSDGGDPILVVDPNKAEEEATCGRMSMAINQFGEVCGVHKPGGAPLSKGALSAMSMVVSRTARYMIGRLQDSLAKDLRVRAANRCNLHRAYSQPPIDIVPEL